MKSAFSAVLIMLLVAPAHAGGTYTGKFRPYYYGDTLYIEPVGATAQDVPACAARGLLRLAGDSTTEVYNRKFTIILSAWLAQRDIVLSSIDDNNCSGEGDEWITIVKPL